MGQFESKLKFIYHFGNLIERPAFPLINSLIFSLTTKFYSDASGMAIA